MQIRQLEALQTMAKSANSKVVFVPMQLQSDVVSQLAGPSANDEVSTSNAGVSGATRAGLLTSMSDI